MLPNHQYPIPQREPLLRVVRNRRIHRRVSDRNASRRRNHPPTMLIRLIPHLDPKGEVSRSCSSTLRGVQLTIRLVHENIMRTRPVEVKPGLVHVWPFHC
jgi:hypothetical protein